MTDTIHYVFLENHIQGLPETTDFGFNQTPFPELGHGEFIARNLFVSVDPGMRSRLSGIKGYAPPVSPGEIIGGFAIGRVIDSRSDAYQAGDLVAMGGSWGTHSIFAGVGFAMKLPKIDVPTSLFLGLLGIPGMTSYFGLKRVFCGRASWRNSRTTRQALGRGIGGRHCRQR
jgi:NADPH-dependent curcumin reductase CurA